MNTPFVATRVPLPRRHFLRGAGAALLALPLFEAMRPTFSSTAAAAAQRANRSPRRFVAACATLGFHTPFLVPEQPGKNYQKTPYLELLSPHLPDLTVLSGISHPEQQGNNGHASELTWLTAARRPGLAGFRNSISLDQLIAQQIGLETRFPCLVLSTSGRSMSWSANGIEIPAETSPARLFKSLFVNGTSEEVRRELQGLQRGKSILDTVRGSARNLERQLGQPDRQKLDEYVSAVRDLESRLQQSEGWINRPKPQVAATEPKDIADRNDAIARQQLMYDMIVLALQTDSTRTITFQLSGMNAVPAIAGVSNDWHNLSHHGKDPAKIEELKLIESAEFNAFNRFLSRLKGIEENGRSLLDHTSVLFGSNLGNASSHDWHNLPLILAGGGYQHGAHLAGNPQDNTPLSNLFVSLGQRMGLNIRSFGTSTAEGIPGLDLPTDRTTV